MLGKTNREKSSHRGSDLLHAFEYNGKEICKEEEMNPINKLLGKERLNIKAHKGHKIVYVNGHPSYCDTCDAPVWI